jgi:hypothetical protein
MKLAPLYPLVSAVLALAIISCGAQSAPTSSDEANQTSATTYMDLEEYLQQAGQSDGQFRQLQNQLASDFGDICGDTFCGSDYGNLVPLAFNCSVTAKEGKLKACSYTFAGSYSQTDAKTGKMTVTSKTFVCPIPVSGTQKTFIANLISAGSTTALRRTLPGVTTSIYDAIATNCLP